MATVFTFAANVKLTTVEQTSPGVIPPAGTNGVEIDLSMNTANLSTWNSAANVGKNLNWAIDGSFDGGVTWTQLAAQPIPFGSVNSKTGALPSILYTDDRLGTGAMQARARGSADVAITVTLNGKWLVNGA